MTPEPGRARPLARPFARPFSRIAPRLLAFNVLLVFLPAAGVLFFDTIERQLLEAQERGMVQQGRLLAAALSNSGRGVDPAAAERVVVALNRRLDSRLRVVDGDGRLLVDSALLGPRREKSEEEAPAAARSRRDAPLYRLGAFAARLWRAVAPAAEPPPVAGLYGALPGAVLAGPAIAEALAGRYGADVRVAAGGEGERARTWLHSAIPVVDGGRVAGAVLVSQSTARTLDALAEVRLGVFRVFLASVAVAVLLSLVAGVTIVRPLVRLRDRAAALVDRRGRLTGRFEGSAREDEIGDLARALAELTRRLDARLRYTESFAADVSHELKNPLASIRTAAEMASEVDDPADRRRFLGIVAAEVARIERLLAGLRELGSVDAGLDSGPGAPGEPAGEGGSPEATATTAMDELVTAVVDGYRLRAAGEGSSPVALDLAPATAPLPVAVAPERLAQVVENLLDNALSFAAAGASERAPRVDVEVAREGGQAVLAVADTGPGIPEAHRERIFDRFFTYRPHERAAGGRNGHNGLGLALVKAIVEGAGGTVGAFDRPGGGARFEVRLPLA